MATTTNYGWTTPDDTALVKDGASAIRTLGSSIDTTTKNLNPETTLGDLSFRSSTSNVNTRIPIGSSGQHLTVVAGVPAWSTPSDQTPLTTKGDLFTFSTVDARLGVGANGTTLVADSSEATGLKWAAPASGLSYAIFRDEKSSSTQGGTFTSGAFRTRDLNTSQFNNISGASISNNQITLAAGTYLINAAAPAYKTNSHVTRLYNITDSAVTLLGSSGYVTGTGDSSVSYSFLTGVFTIAATKVFEIQHQSALTQNSNGFGGATGFQTEVYTSITITKVA